MDTKALAAAAAAVALLLSGSAAGSHPTEAAGLGHDVEGGCPAQGTLDLFGTRPPYPHVVVIDVPSGDPQRPRRFYVDDRDAEGLDDLIWEDFVNGREWHNASHGVWIYEETWAAEGLQRGSRRSTFTTGDPRVDPHVPGYMSPDDPCDQGDPASYDRLVF